MFHSAQDAEREREREKAAIESFQRRQIEVARLRRESAELERHHHNVLAEMEELKAQLGNATHEKDGLKAQLAEAHTRRDELEGSVANLQEQLDALRNESEQLSGPSVKQDELDTARATIRGLEDDKSDLQKQVEKLLALQQDLVEHAKRAKAEISDLQEQVRAKEEEAEARNVQHASALEVFTVENAKMQKTLADVRERVSELENIKAESNEATLLGQKLSAENSELQQLVEELKQQMAVYESEAKSAAEGGQKLQTEYEAAKQTSESLASKVTRHQHEPGLLCSR